MSLHHVKLIHGSEPNPSDKRRIGLAIRYIPTHVRQTAGMTDSATLVRGVDSVRPLPRRGAARAPTSRTRRIAHHARITGETSRILMRGTGRAM